MLGAPLQQALLEPEPAPEPGSPRSRAQISGVPTPMALQFQFLGPLTV